MTALLYHGPGAQDEAHTRAEEGRLLAPPFEPEKGLKTDDMREIVSLMGAAVPGSLMGIILLGPVDNIPPSASDVILKSLEDHHPQILPILWARDAGEVRPTIRSRCLMEWCPIGPDPDSGWEEIARDVCKACLTGNWALVVSTISEHKGNERDILNACAKVLAQAKGDRWIPFWLSIRKALLRPNLSKAEVLSALMGGGR